MNAVSATAKTISKMGCAQAATAFSAHTLRVPQQESDKPDPCHQQEREDQGLNAVEAI
jgi:hypothetical protein